MEYGKYTWGMCDACCYVSVRLCISIYHCAVGAWRSNKANVLLAKDVPQFEFVVSHSVLWAWASILPVSPSEWLTKNSKHSHIDGQFTFRLLFRLAARLKTRTHRIIYHGQAGKTEAQFHSTAHIHSNQDYYCRSVTNRAYASVLIILSSREIHQCTKPIIQNSCINGFSVKKKNHIKQINKSSLLFQIYNISLNVSKKEKLLYMPSAVSNAKL